MRKIREVLRLLWDQQRSTREVARSCGLARSTVGEYERRAVAAGLGWPLPEVDDAGLEALLFPPAPIIAPDQRPLPDWHALDLELRRKGVTRMLLWQEYRAQHPDGYSYTRFCELLQEWRGLQGLSMRQTHLAGEKVFVDYAGVTVPIVDAGTGEIREAQVFVGALGASHYAFVEATWSQGLNDWIGSHARMLAFFGGCPQIVVPDNLKAGVTSPHLYEPDLNPTYLEFARHYGLAVIPARASKPKDKAVVESAVQVAERWILARLRNRTFFSLQELNDAIWGLLNEFNAKAFQKRPGSRLSNFGELDKPALKPLPAERYVFARWAKVRAHMDYHVSIDKHHYSVPHQLAKIQLDARITAATIELFHKGTRVASHAKSSRKGGHTTIKEHMPPAHQAQAGMTREKLLAQAERIGPAATKFVAEVIDRRAHEQQAFRSILGVLRLGKQYGDERLEAACSRAVKLGSFAFKSIEAILKNNLDQRALEAPAPAALPKAPHVNVRGADYYGAPASTEEREGSRAC